MKNTKLFYLSPASEWTDALPLGNGRLGAMVYGTVGCERIQYNEETLWSGYYDEYADNPECVGKLDEMRRLIFEGKISEAEEVAAKFLICRGNGSKKKPNQPYPYGSYQTAGELFIRIHDCNECDDYVRTLDISRGLAEVSYKMNGTTYIRRTFISPDYNCAVTILEADASFHASLTYARDDCVIVYDNDLIRIEGSFDDGKGISYAGKVKVTTDGSLFSDETTIHVNAAHKLVIYYSLCTTYADKADPAQRVNALIERASAAAPTAIMAQTGNFFTDLLSRSVIDIGADDYSGGLPIDERLALIKSGETECADINSLIELYWQFGRYLMIASSWSCVLPANLQGIWTPDYQTIWSADYHININIQMNYWLTELTGLPECSSIFLRYIHFLAEHGRRTARVQYDCGGWVAHTITNPWGFTAPGDGVSWGSFMCAGAWCCEHIWERWLFSRDEEMLREYYPVMRASCEFFRDFLCEDPHTDCLVTAPSNSPENHYRDPLTGKTVAVCAGPTMDNSILYELFTNTAEAAGILGIDADFADEICAIRDRLPPIRIGKHGQIMEWQEDYEETEPGHRHLSMLYALHPSCQITKTKTPDLFEAAKVSIDRRLSSGGGHTGWSRAWIINFYARLGMGDECEKHIHALLEKSTYPNLFDAHPPFQIDGNFGAVAGVAEMLLQSHDGFIELLPALPTAWAQGSFRGLRARGGFVVSASWEDGRLREVTVESLLGQPCELRWGDCVKRLALAKGGTITITEW